MVVRGRVNFTGVMVQLASHPLRLMWWGVFRWGEWGLLDRFCLLLLHLSFRLTGHVGLRGDAGLCWGWGRSGGCRTKSTGRAVPGVSLTSALASFAFPWSLCLIAFAFSLTFVPARVGVVNENSFLTPITAT